ncbi:MAG: SIS domain-containing protein [Bryobacteraceae bacterium]|nr:SIS domain-containing protein [Bryobacteraceae bacterium]
MKAALCYYEKTAELLSRIKDKELGNIEKAVDICTNSISNGGLVFLFGAGHSRMMSEEMTPRQGCFVGFFALVEQALSNHSDIVGTNGLRAPLYLEKYEGYAEQILKGFRFGPHDAFIVISTSGIRPVIVEMALGVKQRGMPLIAIVSGEHARNSPAAHSSGKKLIDVADVVVDNQCPAGDCVLDIEGLEWRTGPASTVTGAMIVNMIRCETAERLVRRGHKPVVLPSHQLVGNVSAEEQLERFYEAYRKSLAHLYA